MIFCGGGCGILNELEPQYPCNYCSAVPCAWGSNGPGINVDTVCDRLTNMPVLRGCSDS